MRAQPGTLEFWALGTDATEPVEGELREPRCCQGLWGHGAPAAPEPERLFQDAE